MSDEDRDLRDRFARLKREDRSIVPTFRAPMASERPRPRWPVPTAIAAAIVLIAFLIARPDRPSETSLHVDLGSASWRSPTDFLLDTPGSDMLRRVPAVGSPDDWAPIDPRKRAPQSESLRSQRTPS